MRSLIKKIVYFLLSIQEKTLTIRLDKSLRGSYSNKTSKTVLSGAEHLTLTSQTQKNIDLVRKNVEDILKNCETDPSKLLDYIEAAGTSVIKLNHADKILQAIGEEEGLICELRGLRALYLNLATNKGYSLKSQPMFVMREGIIDKLFMIHHFYKWYSLKMDLPGFDYNSQQNFKKYLKNVDHKDLVKLSVDEVLSLQEAVKRDQEATRFCLDLVQETEGAQNVRKKMSDGGASV